MEFTIKSMQASIAARAIGDAARAVPPQLAPSMSVVATPNTATLRNDQDLKRDRPPGRARRAVDLPYQAVDKNGDEPWRYPHDARVGVRAYLQDHRNSDPDARGRRTDDLV